MPKARVTTIVLAAILLAMIVASGVVYILLTREEGGTGDSVPFSAQLTPPSTQEQTPRARPQSEGFDLSVLQRSGFAALDMSLLQRGLLPVRPPAEVGKANPFL